MIGLKNLMKGRTCLVVAHRLRTVIDAHKIVVMHKGVIVEQGNHEELMANKGKYYELFNKQQVLNQMQFQGANNENAPAADFQAIQTTVTRLVHTLRTYQCFENEEVRDLVSRIAKQLKLEKNEEELLFAAAVQNESSEAQSVLPALSDLLGRGTSAAQQQSLQEPLLFNDASNKNDPPV